MKACVLITAATGRIGEAQERLRALGIGEVDAVADLARFARAVFGGELLSAASQEAMFTFVSMGRPGLDGGMGIYRVATPNGELVGMDGEAPGAPRP